MTTTITTPAQRRLQKAVQAGKRLAFPIYLAGAVIVAAIVLTATGLGIMSDPMRGYKYDGTLAVIVGFYNLAVMAWPALLAITRPQFRLQRILFIVATIPVSFFGTALVVNLGFGPSLFGLAGIPGVVALLLHGLAAYLLTRYAAEDPQLIADRVALPRLEQAVMDEDAAHGDAFREHSARLKVVTDLEAAQELLEQAVVDHNEAVKTAQAAFDTHPLVEEKAELEAAVAKNAPARATYLSEMEDLGVRIKAAKGAMKAELEAQQGPLDQKLKTLQDEDRPREARLLELVPLIEALPEQTALNDAKAAHDSANKDAEAGREALKSKDGKEGAVIKLEAAATELGVAANRLETATNDRHSAMVRIVQGDERAANLWRDVVFLPVACFLVALGMYPCWYGWVQLG